MLALIAGRGKLPAEVAAAQATPPVICAVEGTHPLGLTPDITFRLETLGTLLRDLRQIGVTDLCLCGAIDRPKVRLARLDLRTLPLLPKFLSALKKGDDGALRVLMSLLEDRGFVIRAAHELAPDLLAPAGVLTTAQPSPTITTDIETAAAVLADQGRSDLGQACVVRGTQVLARENDAGTDAMLCGLSQAQGGILFKAPKPGQDWRADLPTIGPETAKNAVAAGLSGIVVKAGGVILLDRDEVVRILDEGGVFLWVR